MCTYGGHSSSVVTESSIGVVQMFEIQKGFAALKSHGSVVSWGYDGWSGGTSYVAESDWISCNRG